MILKTNKRGTCIAIYFEGKWYFPKPMTKQRKNRTFRIDIEFNFDFFNFEEVNLFSSTLEIERIEQKDEFELMIDDYMKKYRRTPCGYCRKEECPHDYAQKNCNFFMSELQRVKT